MKNVRIFVCVIVLNLLLVGCITMPKGTNYKSTVKKVKDIDFIYDLTYEKDGKQEKKQEIFQRVFKEIDSAEKFLILDMFLFNDDYNRKDNYLDISKQLTEKLIKKKQSDNKMEIYFITDPVNTFYGSYKSKYLEEMKENGIVVIETNLDRMRDSNPAYSVVWRVFFRWFGTEGKGWIANPFSPDSPDVTLRSYLKVLNFKANHRKILISEKVALVSSANPHDASSNHSNIAFVVSGDIINDILDGEKSVAEFSKKEIKTENIKNKGDKGEIELSYLTEKQIRDALIKEIKKSEKGDTINIAVFYISHRKIIKELIKASKRNVAVNLVLDANKDAFGREKNGIPNRLVANELIKKSNNKIKIRWYNTKGEQFHAKLMYVKREDHSVIIGGSANYTRRNLNNYNLESDFMIKAKNDEMVVKEVAKYYDTIFYNKGGDYTLDYEEFSEAGLLKGGIYRFQEFSGFSTF